MTSYSCCFSVFALIICINQAFSKSEARGSYAEHCSSVIPRYNITAPSEGNSLPSLSTSFFTGGDRFHRRLIPGKPYFYVQKQITLRLRPDCLKTSAAGVYAVEGVLCIRFPYTDVDAPADSYSSDWNRTKGSLRFPMNGLWSEESRKLCMVGSTSWMGIDNVDSVLKLKFDDDENSTVHTGVVSGSLESTASEDNPAYFDSFLIFSFPPVSINDYSLVRGEDQIGGGFSSQRNESLSLNSTEFCSVMKWGLTLLKLQHAPECRGAQPPHDCSPVGFLPYYLSVSPIQCDEGAKKARFVAVFLNHSNNGIGYDGFTIGSSVMGEAWWDGTKNRVIGVACVILNPSLRLGNAVSDDCSMRFSLRFPSVLTIRNDFRNVGEIWSSEGAEDSGHFRKISFALTNDNGAVFPKPRYEYTEVDRARKSCSKKKAWWKKGNVYPDGHNKKMIFNMFIKKGKVGKDLGSGFAYPVCVDHDWYRRDTNTVSASTRSVEMSYKIGISSYQQVDSSSNISSPSLDWGAMSPSGDVEITAEGVYDAGNGHLCLVGCRDVCVQNSTPAVKDCEIVLEFEMPMLNGERGNLITGTIRSTRPKTDALHFDDMVTEFAPIYDEEEAERSIRRMNVEIVMVLISGTFVCIFVAIQIFHVKKNPGVLSSVSVVMVVILTLGNIIPLVLNFEAVFSGERDKKTLELGSGGKLEANGIAVTLISFVELLLQLRLLRLVCTAKQGECSWSKEKKVGFVSFSLYILGCLLTLLLKLIRKTYGGRRSSVWGDLRSYGGVILDGFLLPQILLNILRGSAGEVLCGSFYIWTSAVRLVSDAYNQYRAHNYPKHELNSTYYYANPAAGLHSTAWDFIIPCGVMALAAIVFVQQLHGGRCILPRRSMALEMYETTSTSENQIEEQNYGVEGAPLMQI